ncbi:MAG: hypothetical protein U1E42_15185 [Rhodospirillales bacterium]
MSLGLREDRRRRRRRLHWSIFKWAVALALITAAGIYAYETGRRLASADITRLEQTISTLREQVDVGEAANISSHAAAETAQATARDWQARYERDVARGPSKELFEIIQQKLGAGVEAERLKAVLIATQNRRDCRREAERRLFPVPVQMQTATRSSLKFGSGLITLVIVGMPARDSAGNGESWFDVAEPVTLRLIRSGVPATEVTGALPLTTSVIVGEREFSFRVMPAKSRGNVDIFGESCRFP